MVRKMGRAKRLRKLKMKHKRLKKISAIKCSISRDFARYEIDRFEIMRRRFAQAIVPYVNGFARLIALCPMPDITVKQITFSNGVIDPIKLIDVVAITPSKQELELHKSFEEIQGLIAKRVAESCLLPMEIIRAENKYPNYENARIERGE